MLEKKTGKLSEAAVSAVWAPCGLGHQVGLEQGLGRQACLVEGSVSEGVELGRVGQWGDGRQPGLYRGSTLELRGVPADLQGPAPQVWHKHLPGVPVAFVAQASVGWSWVLAAVYLPKWLKFSFQNYSLPCLTLRLGMQQRYQWI